jgi:hypothetical protein
MATAETPVHTPVRSVDLLIVVDTSPGAAPTTAAFAADLPDFVDELLFAFPGDVAPAIDLQVGVITANPAEHGELRSAATATCAAAADGPVVHYVQDQWSRITTNYTGTLAASIQCLLPADGSGPATARPLATMAAALDGSATANAGFLRADAALAILVVTNQDDCSGSATTPFGCAQAAWTCTPPLDATPGERTGCIATADPVGLLSLDAVTSGLAQLKPGLERIAFGAIRGPAAPVVVTSGPAIAPSCDQAGVTATPGLRVDALLARFPNHWAASACTPSTYNGFVGVIASAAAPLTTGPTDGEHDGDCDGGLGGRDDVAAAAATTHNDLGCGCGVGAPAAGSAGAVALALAMMLRRRRAR